MRAFRLFKFYCQRACKILALYIHRSKMIHYLYFCHYYCLRVLKNFLLKNKEELLNEIFNPVIYILFIFFMLT